MCVRTYVCVTGSRVVCVSLPCRKCFQVAPPVMIRVNKDRGSEGLAYPPTAAPRPLRFFFFFIVAVLCSQFRNLELVESRGQVVFSRINAFVWTPMPKTIIAPSPFPRMYCVYQNLFSFLPRSQTKCSKCCSGKVVLTCGGKKTYGPVRLKARPELSRGTAASFPLQFVAK